MVGGQSLKKRLLRLAFRRISFRRSQKRCVAPRTPFDNRFTFALATVWMVIPVIQSPVCAQQSGAANASKPLEAAEAFRLRVNNATHGPVEISLDRGSHWLLVARVVRPALQIVPGAQSSLPEV